MNENEPNDPGEAAGDGSAKHGYRNEVSWDDGKGRQPYTNQGSVEQGTDAAPEAEAGNRGDASGRNLDQLEQVQRKPGARCANRPRTPAEAGSEDEHEQQDHDEWNAEKPSDDGHEDLRVKVLPPH